MIKIEDLTIGQARELVALFQQQAPAKAVDHPYTIGGLYQIRTVTHILTGRLIAVGPQELTLVDAAWVADTGRYMQAVASGDYSEVEPYPEGQAVHIGRGCVCDVVLIPKIPRSQK